MGRVGWRNAAARGRNWRGGRGLEFGGRVCEESGRGGAACTLTVWGGCAGE